MNGLFVSYLQNERSNNGTEQQMLKQVLKYQCVLIHIWIKGEVGAVLPV